MRQNAPEWIAEQNYEDISLHFVRHFKIYFAAHIIRVIAVSGSPTTYNLYRSSHISTYIVAILQMTA